MPSFSLDPFPMACGLTFRRLRLVTMPSCYASLGDGYRLECEIQKTCRERRTVMMVSAAGSREQRLGAARSTVEAGREEMNATFRHGPWFVQPYLLEDLNWRLGIGCLVACEVGSLIYHHVLLEGWFSYHPFWPNHTTGRGDHSHHVDLTAAILILRDRPERPASPSFLCPAFCARSRVAACESRRAVVALSRSVSFMHLIPYRESTAHLVTGSCLTVALGPSAVLHPFFVAAPSWPADSKCMRKQKYCTPPEAAYHLLHRPLVQPMHCHLVSINRYFNSASLHLSDKPCVAMLCRLSRRPGQARCPTPCRSYERMTRTTILPAL